MKIAIIGSHVAGLACASKLQERHDVAWFPIGPVAAASESSCNFPFSDDFILFDRRSHLEFCRWLETFAIPTRPVNMSCSVSLDGGRIEYAHHGSCQALSMERDSRLAPWRLRHLESFADSGPHKVLPLPIATRTINMPWPAVGGCAPVSHLLQLIAECSRRPLGERPAWRTVDGGLHRLGQEIVRRGAMRMYSGHCAQALWRRADGIDLATTFGIERFDAAVLACHADHALALTAEASPIERSILGAIDHQSSRVVRHADFRLMPRRRSFCASWNYQGHLASRPPVTCWTSRLLGHSMAEPALVTLDPPEGCSLANAQGEWSYRHPRLNAATIQARHRLGCIQGRDRLWYCGPYASQDSAEDALRLGQWIAGQIGGAPLRERPLAQLARIA